MKDWKERVETVSSEIALLKRELEKFAKDHITPLDERWDFWVAAPDYVKNHSRWVEDLPILDEIGMEHPDNRPYNTECRGKKINADDVIECLESYLPKPNQRFEDEVKRSFGTIGVKAALASGERLAKYSKLTPAVIDEVKEHFLVKNLDSFCFDW